MGVYTRVAESSIDCEFFAKRISRFKNQKKFDFFYSEERASKLNISFHNKGLMLAYSSLDLYAQS